jgi:adenylate cyclase
MHDPPRILVVDDNETNRDILVTRLEAHGYQTLQAADGEAALRGVTQHHPDVVLLDVMMPNLDGLEACRRLKSDRAVAFTPVILVTAKTATQDIVAGLDAGADEYLTKPIDQAALVARVRSALRIKSLHEQVQAQAANLANWNQTLAQRVEEQVAEIERIGRLKRFLAPQVAQLVSSGDERVLESHRREVTIVFCDLRDFTPFSETAEPEEVITVLREYHKTLGALIDKFEGTIERFAGDGLLVLFNDPLPCVDPSARAVRMAVEMRDQVAKLAAGWRSQGHVLGFGIGIAHGYATLGCVGFEGRFQYSATGTVPNLASRLCDQARNGQILVDAKVHAQVGGPRRNGTGRRVKPQRLSAPGQSFQRPWPAIKPHCSKRAMETARFFPMLKPLSFPKIMSARSNDASRTRLVWR